MTRQTAIDWGALGAPEDESSVRLVYEYGTPLGVVRHAIYGAGARIPAYRLQRDALIYSVGGPYAQAVTPVKRRIVFHPAGATRRVNFIGSTHMVSIDIFDPAFIADMPRPAAAVGLPATLYDSFWPVVTPIYEKRPTEQVTAALADLVRRVQLSLIAQTLPWIARALEHIHCNWREVPRAEDLSTLCGVSPEHFCRAFRRATGTTCQRYSALLRIDHARALLVGSSIPLNEIAAACGFADQSHMTRMFAAYVRTTPARARGAARSRGSRAGLFLTETADFV